MNSKNKILILSSTFILLFTLLFIAIKMDFQDTYDVTKKELNGIEIIADIYSLNFNLKTLRGLDQIANIDADYIKNSLLISDDDILSMIKKLDDKKIKKIYKNLKSSDKTKTESFKLYTDILDLLDKKRFDVSDTSRLLFENDREIYFLITVGVFKIPDIIENIGQIRAIGSSQLSLGKQLSHEDHFILDNNEHMFLKSIDDIKLVLSKINDIDSRRLLSLLDEILTKFHNTRKNIEDIKENSSELTSREFFLQATELINTINKLHILTKDKKKSLLQERKDNFYNKIMFSIIVFSLIILVILTTTYLAYKKTD